MKYLHLTFIKFVVSGVILFLCTAVFLSVCMSTAVYRICQNRVGRGSNFLDPTQPDPQVK